MDVNELHPPDDHTNRFFIWHEWIQANGPLTEENVFDYFAYSMFYDKQSNNQVLRMQTMHTGVPVANEAEELRRFVGIEFAVVHAQAPTFFIIHKRERTSPEHTNPLAAYFIMNNRIYQSPDLYSLLSNRLLTSVSALQTSLDILRKNRPDYTPRTGFVWPIVGEPEPSSTETKKAKQLDKGKSRAQTEEPSSQAIDTTDASATQTQPATQDSAKNPNAAASSHAVQAAPSSSGQKVQNTMLLMNAMRMAAMQSKITLSPAAAALAAAEAAGGGAGAGTVGDASASVTVDTPTTTAEGALTSSATPAPGGQEAMIKGINPSLPPLESAKIKKKKKRASVAAPTPSAS
ncbi:MED6-domain-containing protein [Coprinopsis sp. MPI-PUGE-AT-0042]|nr:MED6-domain-containing protein [Coprinopsis sp. MPI-PUGE-AT-0042]